MRGTALGHETHGQRIIALHQQTFGNGVAARWILIARGAYLPSVHISLIGVKERSHQQACLLSGMSSIDPDVLASPKRTVVAEVFREIAALWAPVLHAEDGHQLPLAVVIVQGRIVIGQSRVGLGQHLLPSVLRRHIGLLHGTHHGVVLKEHRALIFARMLLAQGIGIEPSLNGRATHAVHDDALRHTRLLKHFPAQEVAHSREQPGIFSVHRLPVDAGCLDVALWPVCVGIGEHTEHANLVVAVVVDYLAILGVDALHGHIDIRLTGAQPHIANKHIDDFQLGAWRRDLQRIGSARLLLGQQNLPTALHIGCGLIHLFLK